LYKKTLLNEKYISNSIDLRYYLTHSVDFWTMFFTTF